MLQDLRSWLTKAPEKPRTPWLLVDVAEQRLYQLSAAGDVLQSFAISTGRAGVGEQAGSGCTPRGWHRIRACIGAGQPARAVFRGRRPTGEIWSPALNAAYPQRDWILGRILWLCGEEKGVNRGGTVDTQRRFIYLHGTPDDQPLGQPLSHGCIRLGPEPMLRLFKQASVGMKVLILNSKSAC